VNSVLTVTGPSSHFLYDDLVMNMKMSRRASNRKTGCEEVIGDMSRFVLRGVEWRTSVGW
jgi:hypothetical protein